MELGRIARIQIQRDPLKVKGVGYDPAPLLAVQEASLSAHGLAGRHDGGWVLDAHHAAHPRTRGRGKRALSVGFTGHYGAMAGRFEKVALGCAGENLVIDHSGRVTVEDLEKMVVVHGSAGEVVLRSARVAAPCAEFTSWLRGAIGVLPASELTDDLAFLDEGTRGFIVDVAHLQGAHAIRVGDLVTVRD